MGNYSLINLLVGFKWKNLISYVATVDDYVRMCICIKCQLQFVMTIFAIPPLILSTQGKYIIFCKYVRTNADYC